jgi:hypothetical protein
MVSETVYAVPHTAYQHVRNFAYMYASSNRGFYGTPCAPGACLGAVKCTNSTNGVPACGFDDPVQRMRFRAFSTVVQPVLDASDAVYPRIYLSPNGDDCRSPSHPAGCSTAETESWVRALVSEASRLMRHRPRSVYPYMWQWYSGPNDANKASLSDADRHIVMTAPYDAGAAGVIIWVDDEAINHPQALKKYATEKTGPEAQAFVAAVEACAKANCSDHGTCVPIGSGNCVCDPTYSGPGCRKNLMKIDDGGIDA